MFHYRCIFWGFFLCFFRLTIEGAVIPFPCVAMAIFTFGLFGMYEQTGNWNIRTAARIALAGTLLDAAGTVSLMLAENLYPHIPSFPQYLLFTLPYPAYGILFYFLLNGTWELLIPYGERADGWIRSCRHGLIVFPILCTAPVLLYGTAMVMGLSQNDANHARIAVAAASLAAAAYGLYLISKLKRYINTRELIKEEADQLSEKAGLTKPDEAEAAGCSVHVP